jgi:hypothetical protein
VHKCNCIRIEPEKLNEGTRPFGVYPGQIPKINTVAMLIEVNTQKRIMAFGMNSDSRTLMMRFSPRRGTGRATDGHSKQVAKDKKGHPPF